MTDWPFVAKSVCVDVERGSEDKGTDVDMSSGLGSG